VGTKISFKELKRACISCTHWKDVPNVITVDRHCNLGVPTSVVQDPETFICARYEIRPPKVQKLPSMDFWMRSWFDDPAMTSEAMRTVRRIQPRESDIILDLGAHIGSFGFAALNEFNVARCIFVEADPINVSVLYINAGVFPDRAEVDDRAVLGVVPTDGRVTLWRTGYTGCSSVHQRKRMFNVRVPAVSFDELIDKHRPTFLKTDVEGAEFDFSWRMNDEMREIYAEIHRPDVTRRDTVPIHSMRELADPIIEKLASQGFTLTHTKSRVGFTEVGMKR
jgi:FkbM family methyltransferase